MEAAGLLGDIQIKQKLKIYMYSYPERHIPKLAYLKIGI